MTRSRFPILFSVLALLAACGDDGAQVTLGMEEPLQVYNAQFLEGKLPGRAPLNVDDINAGKQPSKPTPTSAGVSARVVSPSEIGLRLEGRASTDAYSIGIAIEGQGSGYWVLPVGAPDPSNNDELLWDATFDLGASIEPGVRLLRIAALNENGKAGTQQERSLCVIPPVPDNLNVCDDTLEPPAFVVSLGWENTADLDLKIVEPNGSVISNDFPSGAEAKSRGRLIRDANSGCSLDGLPRENIVWQDKPRRGQYLVYVNLHATCGVRTTTYTISTHAKEARRGGKFRQVETFRATGHALEVQANGGSELGTFVTEFFVN